MRDSRPAQQEGPVQLGLGPEVVVELLRAMNSDSVGSQIIVPEVLGQALSDAGVGVIVGGRDAAAALRRKRRAGKATSAQAPAGAPLEVSPRVSAQEGTAGGLVSPGGAFP
jgi:hypothetical protein